MKKLCGRNDVTSSGNVESLMIKKPNRSLESVTTGRAGRLRKLIMKNKKVGLVMFAAVLVVSATAPAATITHAGPETFVGTSTDDVDLIGDVGKTGIDIGIAGSISFDYQFSAAAYYDVMVYATQGADWSVQIRTNNGSGWHIEMYHWDGASNSSALPAATWDIGTVAHDLASHSFYMSWTDGGTIDLSVDGGALASASTSYAGVGAGILPGITDLIILGGSTWHPGDPEEYDGTISNLVITNTYSPGSQIVEVTQSSGSTEVTEGGATDSFTVQLGSVPSANVTITLDPNTNDISLESEVAGGPYDLVFTSGNWNVPRTVTVTANDDAVVEGTESVNIALTCASGDSEFNDKPLPSVNVTVTDNDNYSIDISESGSSTDVAEQGETSDTYTVVLSKLPTASVTVNIVDESSPDEVTLSPAVLIFTTGNWSELQTVTVTAIDDLVDEAATHQTTISNTASGDPDYNGLVENVTVNITDNDGASANIVLWHPGPETYTTAEDETDLQALYGGIDVANEGSLEFDYQFSHTPNYDMMWFIEGNDGSPGGCQVQVRTQGDNDFHIEIRDYDNVGGSMESVITWNVGYGTHDLSPHNFKMTWKSGVGIEVQIDDGTPYTNSYNGYGDGVVDSSPSDDHTLAGDPWGNPGEQFEGTISNVMLGDTYGEFPVIVSIITVVETSGSTEVAEEGPTTDSFTVQLASAPTANVMLTLAPDTDDISLDSEAAGDPYDLVFTTSNWNSPQTVTVSANDDALDEDTEEYIDINPSVASGDPFFNNNPFLLPIIVEVTDNDNAGITIAETGGSTEVAEQGETSDTYTAALGLAPTANVTVHILDKDARDEVAIAPDRLTFTTANWNTPQTVTVTAIDDTFGEDSTNHQATVRHTAYSSDSRYDNLVTNLSVTVIDNGDVRQTPVLDARHWGMFDSLQSTDFTFYDMTPADISSTFNTEANAQTWWDSVHADRLAGQYHLPILTPATQARLDMMFSPPGTVTTYPEDLIGVAFGHEVATSSDATENTLYDYVKSNWPDIQVYKFYSHPIMPLSFASGVAEKCDGYIYEDFFTMDDGKGQTTSDETEFRRRVMKMLITGKKLVMTIWASQPVDPAAPNPDDRHFSVDWTSPQDGLTDGVSYLKTAFWGMSDILRQFGLPVALYGVAGSESPSTWWTGDAVSLNLGYLVNSLALPLRDQMHASDGQKLPIAEFSEDYGMLVNTTAAYSYTDDYKTNGTNVGLGTIDEASIMGFSNLLQMSDPAGVLGTKDNGDGPGYVELIYRFHVYLGDGSIGNVHAELLSTVVAGQGGVNLLGLSKNGENITLSIESTPGLGTEETLTIDGGAEFGNVNKFFVHVRMSYDSSPTSSPANLIRQLDVTAVHNAGGTADPTVRKCGYDGFLAGDISGANRWNLPDCYVNLYDLATMFAEWAEGYKPDLIGDISGPSDSPDSYVDMYDVMELTEQWLGCTDPTNPGCSDMTGGFVLRPEVLWPPEPGWYIGSPTAIELLSGQILLATVGHQPMPEFHISDDRGKTFTKIGTFPHAFATYGVGVSTLLRLADGRIALSFARTSAQSGVNGGGLPAISFSSDEGQTWTVPTIVTLPEGDGSWYVQNDRMIQTSTGRLIIAVAQLEPGSNGEGDDEKGNVLFSDDLGVTWARSTTPAAMDYELAPHPEEDPKLGMQEPSVVERLDGSLYMLARTGQHSLHKSISTDGGLTWSVPQPTTLISACAPSTLRRMPDGRLFVFYLNSPQQHGVGYFRRNPMVYAVSDDDGETWGEPFIVDETPDRNYSNASILFLEEGILSLYQRELETEAFKVDQWGVPPSNFWSYGGGTRVLLKYP
jgi:hypothetical protein